MPEELYPGHAAALAKHAERQAAIAAAHATPLPGPLADAFAPTPPPAVAGLTVRPLVHYDFALLQKLESPLLTHLLSGAAQTGGETPWTEQHAYDMIYLLTRPIRASAAQLAPPDGPAAFRAAAQAEIGMRLTPGEVVRLVKAVETEFARAFQTVIGYENPPPEGGTVFTPPPAERMTASAGGCTTCACSSRRAGWRARLCSLISRAWKAGRGWRGSRKTSPGKTPSAPPTATSPRNA